MPKNNFHLEMLQEPMSECVGNAFLAASERHPISKKTIELIKRNFRLGKEGKGFYSAVTPKSSALDTIVQTGPVVTTVAFYKAAEIDDKRNILMPSEMIYPAKKSLDVYQSGKIPNLDDALSLGTATLHLWRTTWANNAGKANGCKG